MNFSERDIVLKTTEHKFIDNGQIDKKTGRYCLMICPQNVGESFYLILSTHSNTAFEYYQRFPKQNYLLSKKNCPGLPQTSCVNLRDIYEEKPLGYYTTSVPDDEYKKIVRKFKEYQASGNNKTFEKVKDYL